MRQGHGGKRRQRVRAVQGVVHPLTAPPPRGDYSKETKDAQSACYGVHSALKDMKEDRRRAQTKKRL